MFTPFKKQTLFYSVTLHRMFGQRFTLTVMKHIYTQWITTLILLPLVNSTLSCEVQSHKIRKVINDKKIMKQQCEQTMSRFFIFVNVKKQCGVLLTYLLYLNLAGSISFRQPYDSHVQLWN